MQGYLNTKIKNQCYGCEACVQICPKTCIKMEEDEEGFRYPIVDESICVHCGLCNKVCPNEHPVDNYREKQLAFGGFHRNTEIKAESTSGGAFSAIVDAWCDENYVIFGAEAKGIKVFHSYIENKAELAKFRKSKYSQSKVGDSYKDAKRFLLEGKKVLFSGTPCQIGGLRSFLYNVPQDKLLTIEVICEGVPTPLFMRKYNEWLEKKYGEEIEQIDYRYKDMMSYKREGRGKWDFQVMRIVLKNKKTIKQDRWFNPYWSIWLNHLMSRPSCYQCPFAKKERNADISLGDLWGVHLYCPELYGKNAGASLIICNSIKGKEALESAKESLYGKRLDFGIALKYQSPMRKHIDTNPNREYFMKDVCLMDYPELCKKWEKKANIKLLWQKYVWGNRQKVAIYNLKRSLKIISRSK